MKSMYRVADVEHPDGYVGTGLNSNRSHLSVLTLAESKHVRGRITRGQLRWYYHDDLPA